MLCKALSMPRNSPISRVLCCDATRALIRRSSTKDESFFGSMLSICKSVGSSLLSLVALLINLFGEGGVSSRLKTLFEIFNPSNFSLHVFAAKTSPVSFSILLVIQYYQ